MDRKDSFAEPKAQAKALRKYLAEQDIELGHSKCLEAVSRMHGFKDWNTFAASERDQPSFTPELPPQWEILDGEDGGFEANWGTEYHDTFDTRDEAVDYARKTWSEHSGVEWETWVAMCEGKLSASAKGSQPSGLSDVEIVAMCASAFRPGRSYSTLSAWVLEDPATRVEPVLHFGELQGLRMRQAFKREKRRIMAEEPKVLQGRSHEDRSAIADRLLENRFTDLDEFDQKMQILKGLRAAASSTDSVVISPKVDQTVPYLPYVHDQKPPYVVHVQREPNHGHYPRDPARSRIYVTVEHRKTGTKSGDHITGNFTDAQAVVKIDEMAKSLVREMASLHGLSGPTVFEVAEWTTLNDGHRRDIAINGRPVEWFGSTASFAEIVTQVFGGVPSEEADVVITYKDGSSFGELNRGKSVWVSPGMAFTVVDATKPG